MANRYDVNTKARAVRLVREHVGDYETEWAAMKAISAPQQVSSRGTATRYAADLRVHR